MAGVNGATSGASGEGASDGSTEDSEEDEYITPRLDGSRMTVYFPLLVPIPCIISKCGTKIKNKT